MKKIIIFLIIFNLSDIVHAQIKDVKTRNFAIGLNISPILFYHFENSDSRSIRNKYNFQTGINLFYCINLKSSRFGLSSGVIFGKKSFEETYHDGGVLAKASHNYSVIKIPVLIDYSFKFKSSVIGVGLGINFNFFQNAEYEPVYNFGLYGNDFPGDLQFDPYKELVVFINLEHSIFNINYSLNIQPFFLYNLNQPIFFKESFYNLGKTAFGLNLILKKHFKPLKLKR
ncbi:MAG: hypothetical protein COW63_04170 [Bacteroidetes bacterium CG18_big_fil_WC_8_21_14_2_50_41_14]|nr:MAG: hypothetical protein COW63_04170 [Bacteroidetes bacterium CG18_big_fil_WC_8_21_14_2_50_41_14]PJB57418.1 MAG: hypothetical protein CO098_11590 [Bacteroidetes bacterium CG_4_9_14_3_um_filter_41_19]